MDGTRRARLIAFVATLAFGVTLAAAATMSTARQHGPGGPGGGAVAPTPLSVNTTGPATGVVPAVVPRTTPPPTFRDVGTPAVRPLLPSAASTVEPS